MKEADSMSDDHRSKLWRQGLMTGIAGSGLFLLAILLGLWFFGEGWPVHVGQVPHTGADTVLAVSADPETAPGPARVAVVVDVTGALNLGLLWEPVRRETVARTIRAVAIAVPDEERLAHVHSRVSGWIEELYVRTTGESVSAGEPLAAIFSQDLYASQIEYLAARTRGGAAGSVVLEGARQRLLVLGMDDQEIAAIETRGQASRLVTISAPAGGTVLRRGITVGTTVDPATELFTLADLSQLWVFAELPENEISQIRAGTAVEVDFPSSGLPPFPATVDFLYPTLNEQTRSLRVRIAVPNPDLALRPGMSGIVRFRIESENTLAIPRDAVVDTGDTQHVFVLVEGNRHEPRTVRLGLRSADRSEVLEGLAEGEIVLSSGVFLIDSESRLRASGAGGMGHAGHGTPATETSDTPHGDH
jgi:membrane fusion protein, copper/silver efflux system